MDTLSMSQLGDAALREMIAAIGHKLDGEVICINSPMQSPLDDQFRAAIEALRREPECRNRLIVILETVGGYIETVKRLVDVMRRHFEEVYFIVPSYAYSAGTVLALSGDRIYMDYYSVLGPIDPQYADESGGALLPGAGYLAKFEELIHTINNNTSSHPNANRAELAYLIKRFDPAKLFHIEQAIEHGQALIEEWLPKYKFKNWTKTAGTGRKVTVAMKRRRAKAIAKTLGDARRWHSHGRGIPMSELMQDDINLQIDDFGLDQGLSDAVRSYHALLVDYARQSQARAFLHTEKGGLRRVM